MTYIRILPKNESAQARLTEAGDAVMDLLFRVARDVLDIPESDIIVEMNRCTTTAFHRAAAEAGVAPDVVITFATSDRPLQPLFGDLCTRAASDWNALYPDISLEVWVSLIDEWGTTIEA